MDHRYRPPFAPKTAESRLACDSLTSFGTRRWRSRFKKMFIDSHCTLTGGSKKKENQLGSEMFGLCVKLDNRGRKIEKYGVKVTVSPDKASEQGYNVIVNPIAQLGNVEHQFLWLNNGKKLRIKRRNSQKAVRCLQNIRYQQKTRPTESRQPELVWAKKGRVCYKRQEIGIFNKMKETCEVDSDNEDDSESVFSENEDNDFGECRTVRNRPYKKPASKHLRQLFFSRGTLKKRSKAYKLENKSFRSDSDYKLLTKGPGTKSYSLHFQDDNSRNVISERKDRHVDATDKKPHPSNLTLADFCSQTIATRLGLVLSCHNSSSGYESGDSRQFPNLINSDSYCENINDSTEAVDVSSEFLDTQPSLEQTQQSGSDTKDTISEKAVTSDVVGKVIPTTESLPANSENLDKQQEMRDDYVTVRLHRSEVRPDCLRTEFRLDYREAACKPRRFIINISRLIYQRVALLNRLRLGVLQKFDLSTYIVFAFNKETGLDIDEYRVWATSTWAKSAAVQIFRNCSEGGDKVLKIQGLIQKVVEEAESYSLSDLKTETGNFDSFIRRPVCNFVLLKSIVKWETGSVSVPYTTEWCQDYENQDASQGKFNGKILSDVNLILNGEQSDNTNPIRRGPNHSSICCSCLNDFDSDASKTQLFPLALDACSHWFCDSCWHSKMLTNMRKEEGFYKPVCLEVGCHTEIKSVTLLTFMGIKEIRRINQNRLKMYTQSMPCAFCPNAECRRLLFPKLRKHIENKGMVMSCPCSFELCFNCLQTPHWPVDCHLAEKYHSLIEQRQDEMLTRPLTEDEFPDVILRGKKCPRCGIFIQQADGHKFETCGCGCEFCWPCGKEVMDNFFDHTDCVECFVYSDACLKENIQKDTQVVATEFRTTKWYRVALSHRKMRHPDVILSLYCMADSIALKIANVSKSGKYVGDAQKASLGWSDSLRDWAQENHQHLETLSHDSLPMSFQQRGRCSSARPLSSAMSTISCYDEISSEDLFISRALSNLVHMKVELHYLIEYTAVLIDNAVTLPGQFIRCLERAEDLCTSFGILLQDPHTHNACRIIPTFLRLQTQARQTISNILSEVTKI